MKKLKIKTANLLIVFLSIMMTNTNTAENSFGSKVSKSSNSKRSSKGKNKSKAEKPQQHFSDNEQMWVRGSHNSRQLFLMPVIYGGPPEVVFHTHAASPPKQKPWKQIFVNMQLFTMLAMPELSGSLKPQVNKNLVLEHEVIPIVNWIGKGKNAAWKIENIKTKKTKLTSNADFPSPFSPEFTSLTQAGTDITTAATRLQERLQKLPNSRTNLADAIKVLKKDVESWCAMIKMKVSTVSADEGVRICNDAGFDHKLIVVRQPRKNSIKQMNEPGWVQVEGEGKGGRDWQFSLDPFTVGGEIKDLEYTTSGVTTYNAGKSKLEVWFRWRRVLSKGRHGDWSPWFNGETP